MRLACGLLAALLLPPLAVAAPQLAASEPVQPGVQQRDVQSLGEEQPVPQWKPGQPVKVMPDLREDGGTEATQGEQQVPPKPQVHRPVAPQVQEGSVNDLSKVKPYQEGDPVRVVPDLRETDKEQ